MTCGDVSEQHANDTASLRAARFKLRFHRRKKNSLDSLASKNTKDWSIFKKVPSKLVRTIAKRRPSFWLYSS